MIFVLKERSVSCPMANVDLLLQIICVILTDNVTSERITGMYKSLIGEWGQYEDWEITEIIINLENDLANARSEQKRRSKIRKSYYTRDERKQQIRRILSNGKIYTTSQIARKLSLSPSGHLREILCELFRDGYISAHAESEVAKHPIYYWYEQKTIPLPFPMVEYAAPCAAN